MFESSQRPTVVEDQGTSKKYICAECRQIFQQSNKLESHATETDHRAYRCTKERACRHTFVLRTSWSRHERNHSAKKTHPCSRCRKLFRRKDNCRDHERACYRAFRRAGQTATSPRSLPSSAGEIQTATPACLPPSSINEVQTTTSSNPLPTSINEVQTATLSRSLLPSTTELQTPAEAVPADSINNDTMDFRFDDPVSGYSPFGSWDLYGREVESSIMDRWVDRVSRRGEPIYGGNDQFMGALDLPITGHEETATICPSQRRSSRGDDLLSLRHDVSVDTHVYGFFGPSRIMRWKERRARRILPKGGHSLRDYRPARVDVEDHTVDSHHQESAPVDAKEASADSNRKDSALVDAKATATDSYHEECAPVDVKEKTADSHRNESAPVDAKEDSAEQPPSIKEEPTKPSKLARIFRGIGLKIKAAFTRMKR